MSSTYLIANCYQIIDKMIEALYILASALDPCHLYYDSWRFINTLDEIKNNNKLHWYKDDNLVLNLYIFFADRANWNLDFSDVYICGGNGSGPKRYSGWKNIEELLADMDFILDILNTIMYTNADPEEGDGEFYCELNKYVLNPERIERFSQKFGMEFFEYLDALDA